MKIVEVIKIPVRYNGETYQAGESFEMEDEYVNESLVNVTGEVERGPKTIREMTIAELKEYATEHEIDLGDAKKKDDILEIIQAFEADKDEIVDEDRKDTPEE
ncbi:hypothetical protein [Sutcliffiella rhizosphaerae]|uniref:Rho termination factor N-terminal domain-containing protein n=1 Tax=Sutcliffiella rhizosphaerae TaxID=2880967 RepID=A0ABM8YLP1_9BACI|nr:hypothetical protein [Sutcliffiella rhizosphaerae]CAG9620878.1 hypothetical protein BACCIP111883_01649 [Sutcliffiella rhizosphaerae]